MRFRHILVNILLATTTAFAQTPATEGFQLQDGTPVRLRLQRTISSADAQVNEQVDFEVLDEVKVKGIVVIPKGGIAWGTITAAQAKRRMARGGKLDLNVDAVRLASGEKVALRAVKNSAGGGHAGAMAGGMAATALFVPFAAPFFLLMHGKDVSIPKGAELTAYINGNVELDPARLDPKHAPATASAPVVSDAGPVRQAAQADRADLATLVLKSDPEGAEISVDGRFFGNTPSTVQLPSGECTVSIQKPGFATWQRTITITPGGIVTLSASLEKTSAN